jgi:class 3 adenylate cyclase
MNVEERKLATIVFADLVGSTELGGSQDPERTRALLDRFYDAMAAEMSARAAPSRSSSATR